MLETQKTNTTKNPTLPCSSFLVTYQSKSGSWRGFVMPYDITFEADSKNKVVEVLKEMTDSYTEGLNNYDNPIHLANVPLSDEEDQTKFNEIGHDLINKLLAKEIKIDSSTYYAEAKLRAE